MACWPATPWPSRQAGIASYPTSSGRGRRGRQAPARCANAGCPASRFAPAWACRRLRSVLARDHGKPRELPPTGEPPGSGYAGAEASGDLRPGAGDGREIDACSITPMGSKNCRVELADLGTEAEQRCNHGNKRCGHRRWQVPPHPPRPMTRWTSPPPCNGPCAAPEACARNSSKPRPIVLRAMPVASDTVAIPSHPAASASEAANRRRAHSSRTGLTNSKLRLMAAVSIIAKTTEQCPKRESSAPNPFDSSNYRRILRTVIGIRGRSFTFTGMTGGLWLVHDPPCCHQS